MSRRTYKLNRQARNRMLGQVASYQRFKGCIKNICICTIPYLTVAYATIREKIKKPRNTFSFEEVVAAEVTKKMEEFQKLLPSPDQGRLDRFNSMIAERKIMRELEEEGLSMWATKLAEERLKTVGWFP